MLINGKTTLYGILGLPLAHSLSPLMHNAAFHFSKLNAAYVPFPVRHPNAALKNSLLDMGVQGLSVTLPHKAWAARMAAKKDRLSAYSRSANTLLAVQGKWHAYNTDGPGALEALQKYVKDLKGKRFLVIGYGGSASAIVHAILLKSKPGSIAIGGRNLGKIARFVLDLRKKHPTYAKQIFSYGPGGLEPEDIDIIIQTTPLGMEGAEQVLPLRAGFIQRQHYVFDIVYVPKQTPILREAAAKKAQIIPGYLMLLYQACLQFEIFTGLEAPRSLMEKELVRALK